MQGRRECQEETETEEMETPEARRIADPVPNPPPREVVGSMKWWTVNVDRRWTIEGNKEMRRELEREEEKQKKEAGNQS